MLSFPGDSFVCACVWTVIGFIVWVVTCVCVAHVRIDAIDHYWPKLILDKNESELPFSLYWVRVYVKATFHSIDLINFCGSNDLWSRCNAYLRFHSPATATSKSTIWQIVKIIKVNLWMKHAKEYCDGQSNKCRRADGDLQWHQFPPCFVWCRYKVCHVFFRANWWHRFWTRRWMRALCLSYQSLS